MIISHSLKCIFIAIPKTATHAIRNGLRPYLSDKDEEQVGLFEKKQFSDPEIAEIKHGHITCQQLKKSIGEDTWNSYYKFSIVRNPFDRFVSYCAFMFKNNPSFHQNPQNFMHNVLLDEKQKEHILFKPQHEFIFDQKDKLQIDYLGKYENLQTSFNHICNQIGIEKNKLIKINASKHLSYKNYYNKELKELVLEVYKKDFNLLNYLEA